MHTPTYNSDGRDVLVVRLGNLVLSFDPDFAADHRIEEGIPETVVPQRMPDEAAFGLADAFIVDFRFDQDA